MKISVCGCGWLGQPLSLKLQQNGHQVLGSRTSTQGCVALQQAGIPHLVYRLGDNLDAAELSPLFDARVFILNIPPGRRNTDLDGFVSDMRALIQHIADHDVEKLLFISTSAVYGEQTRTVFEYSETAPETASAKAHVQLESFARKVFGDRLCILRLSGLIGPDRHPAFSLSGKTGLLQGQRRVNLVHQDDVIAAIEAIVQQDKFGHTFHLAATGHPSRQDYYGAAADHFKLPPPQFIEEKSSPANQGKIIDPGYTLETLGLSLQFPDPNDVLT